jgi:hypothetical protein
MGLRMQITETELTFIRSSAADVVAIGLLLLVVRDEELDGDDPAGGAPS